MDISKLPIARLWQKLNKNLNILKTALAVLLLFIPWYPKFPLREVANTYVAIRVGDLVVLASLLIWLIRQLRYRCPILKEKVFKVFLIYFLVGAISLASAFLITGLVIPKIALLHFLRRMEYMGLFFVAYDAARFISLNEFSSIFTIASFGVFTYGMGQKYFGLPVVSTMNEEFSKGALLYLDKWTRISSTFAGHYDLAAWLVIMLALLPALVTVAKNKKGKLLLLLAGAMNFYLLILTASRISFIAYLIGITATFVCLKKFRWLLIVLGLSLFLGFQSKELSLRLASSFKIVNPAVQRWERATAKILNNRRQPEPTPIPAITQTPTPKTKTTPLKFKPKKGVQPAAIVLPKIRIVKEIRTWPTPEEVGVAAARSSQIRFQAEWPRAIRAFLKNPLLGTGYSSLGLATDNDYLRVLGETGLLGMAAFGLVIFHLFRSELEALVKKKKLILGGFLGVILGFLANAVFIDVFEASKVAFYFWIMMGIGYRISKQ